MGSSNAKSGSATWIARAEGVCHAIVGSVGDDCTYNPSSVNIPVSHILSRGTPDP